MYKIFLNLGGIFAGLGVAIGAFGAHALKSMLNANGRGDVFETAVKYQFYHALALIVIGILMYKADSPKMLSYAGYAFAAGIIVFSGSLYILCLTNISKWGAVTPLGGVCFIAGWILFLLAVARLSS